MTAGSIPQRRRAALWLIALAAVGTVPVAGACSTTDVFYVRDLGAYFWPRHLWLRQTVAAGDWPLWDPFAGGGQSAVADALNQFFLLPISILRVALPDVVGFNLWVAAPFPLIAIGAWLWLRRHASPTGAFVGAAFLAASGPVVSTGNFPNLSWAVAGIPWVLWAADRAASRPGAPRVAALALVVAMQAVTGEPVTVAATGVLVLTHALLAAGNPGVYRWRSTGRIASGLAAGALLAAVQLVPLVAAASRSPRSAGIDPFFWSLHPLELAEGVVAHLFGHPYQTALDRLPWVTGMHDREPFFFSLYAGLGAVVLATIADGDRSARRRRRFWAIVAVAALLCALGDFTPLYPAMQALVAPLQSFRFPVKYLVFCMVALSALVAGGADALLAHARAQASMARPVAALATALTAAAAAGLLAATAILWPEVALFFWQTIGYVIGLDAPRDAAQWLLGPSSSLLAGVAVLAFGISVLIAAVWQRHRIAPLAAAALCVLAFVDPLIVNRDVHPTMAAERLGPPSWSEATRLHPGDRVYVGGRVRRLPPRVPRVEVLDTADRFDMPADVPPQEAVMRLSAQFAYVTAAWGLRESISYDLPELWPREYAMMIDVFRWAPRDARLRFIRRTGVRYCYLPEPPYPDAVPVVAQTAPTGPMALYECEADPRRVYMTDEAQVAPDLRGQIERMFSADHDPRALVLLEQAPPPPVGRPGSPVVVPDARVVGERNAELVVRASAGANGGYLNVLDTYDPSWKVEVDGEPAALLRANGLYRAVRLAPGEHEVRFMYRPAPFYVGIAITIGTAVVLLIAGVRRPEGLRLPVAGSLQASGSGVG